MYFFIVVNFLVFILLMTLQKKITVQLKNEDTNGRIHANGFCVKNANG